jgi:hypothetical protein
MTVPTDSVFCQYCGANITTTKPVENIVAPQKQNGINELEREIQLALQKPFANERNFPKGQEQMRRVIALFKSAYGEHCTAEIALEIFAHISARSMLSGVEGFDRIKVTLKARYSVVVPDSRADLAISLVLSEMTAPITPLTDSTNTWAIENESRIFTGIYSDDYGLTADNPIFVRGIYMESAYLILLRSQNWKPFTYSRSGSTSSPQVSGMTDVYKIESTDGAVSSTLFINMYANRNSIAIPSGLCRLSEIDDSIMTQGDVLSHIEQKLGVKRPTRNARSKANDNNEPTVTAQAENPTSESGVDFETYGDFIKKYKK